MNMEENKQVDYLRVWSEIKKRMRLYFITLPIAFVLACLWILPQPRYYTCDVMLAPEGGTEVSGSSLSSLASSFGFNIDGPSNDAIYPMLYPDLFSSPEFIVDLFHTKVTFTNDDDEPITTDLYTYLRKYQKYNPYFVPFKKLYKYIKESIKAPEKRDLPAGDVNALNPFRLSRKDYDIVSKMDKVVECSVDKKTNVITITVTAQDADVSATLADSVKLRLQKYITDYRTRKAREDVNHYKHLTDSAYAEYKKAMAKYAAYCDVNQDVILQSFLSERDALENEMGVQYQGYTGLKAQLMAAEAKVQERTPAFTTLKSASVPAKPAGPKRMIFVALMLVLTFFGTTVYILRDIIKKAI